MTTASERWWLPGGRLSDLAARVVRMWTKLKQAGGRFWCLRPINADGCWCFCLSRPDLHSTPTHIVRNIRTQTTQCMTCEYLDLDHIFIVYSVLIEDPCHCRPSNFRILAEVSVWHTFRKVLSFIGFEFHDLRQENGREQRNDMKLMAWRSGITQKCTAERSQEMNRKKARLFGSVQVAFWTSSGRCKRLRLIEMHELG